MQNRKLAIQILFLFVFSICCTQLVLNILAYAYEGSAKSWVDAHLKIAQPSGLTPQQQSAFADSVAHIKEDAVKDRLAFLESKPLLPIGIFKNIYPCAICFQYAYIGGKQLKGNINLVLNIDTSNLTSGNSSAALSETFRVIKMRANNIDATSSAVSLQAGTTKINVELKGTDDTARVFKLLQQPGNLEFWNTFETEEVISYLADANTRLRDLFAANSEVKDSLLGLKKIKYIKRYNILTDSMETVVDQEQVNDNKEADKNSSPLFEVLYPNINQFGQKQSVGEGPMVGRVLSKDTATVNRLLNMAEVKNIFPSNLKLLWSAYPLGTGTNVYGLYAIRLNPTTTDAPLSGALVKNAYSVTDNTGYFEIDLHLDNTGVTTWETMTEMAANATVNGKPVKKCIAIVLDDKVFSAPRVMQKITGGYSQISGIESKKEADNMVNLLTSGKLPAKVQVIEAHLTPVAPGNPRLLFVLAEIVILILLLWVAFKSNLYKN